MKVISNSHLESLGNSTTRSLQPFPRSDSRGRVGSERKRRALSGENLGRQWRYVFSGHVHFLWGVPQHRIHPGDADVATLCGWGDFQRSDALDAPTLSQTFGAQGREKESRKEAIRGVEPSFLQRSEHLIWLLERNTGTGHDMTKLPNGLGLLPIKQLKKRSSTTMIQSLLLINCITGHLAAQFLFQRRLTRYSYRLRHRYTVICRDGTCLGSYCIAFPQKIDPPLAKDDFDVEDTDNTVELR